MATSKPVTGKKQSTPEKKTSSKKAATAKPIKLGGVPNQGTVSKRSS